MAYENYKHLGGQNGTAKPTAGLVQFNIANNLIAPWCARDLAVVLLRK